MKTITILAAFALAILVAITPLSVNAVEPLNNTFELGRIFCPDNYHGVLHAYYKGNGFMSISGESTDEHTAQYFNSVYEQRDLRGPGHSYTGHSEQYLWKVYTGAHGDIAGAGATCAEDVH